MNRAMGCVLRRVSLCARCRTLEVDPMSGEWNSGMVFCLALGARAERLVHGILEMIARLLAVILPYIKHSWTTTVPGQGVERVQE